ncbi:MAG: molybdenum cofactor biosynthesis protein MoaE [Pseudomonadota bacterium]
MIDVSESKIDASAALKAFEADLNGAGAIVSFTGRVRETSKQGRIETLRLQAYSPMTVDGIAQAVSRAKGRWSLMYVHICHRIGHIAPRETIVFVATASAHRRDAFEAADYIMDYLKTQAIFWKQEITTCGRQTWIEPREQDYEDNTRWD